MIKLSTIIIIINLSCHQHGYPWPSPATPPYHSSLSVGPQGYKPVSSHSCCMYVQTGRPACARPCKGVHRSTSLMSTSLLLQQCPACLVRLTLIVFVMEGRWPYCSCFVGCCSRTCTILLVQYSCVVAVKLFLHLFLQHPCSASI